MKIAIRADAYTEIGTGHVMRCLALAGALHERGGEVRFISRDRKGSLCGLIESHGFYVKRLLGPVVNGPEITEDGMPTGDELTKDAAETIDLLMEWGSVDWLIADHYEIGLSWESELRRYAVKLMAIDDLAVRKHNIDLLLDQNLCRDMETRYSDLIPPDCIQLLGPGYALLRPEFANYRKSLGNRDGVVRSILVFFGGSDPTNETIKAIKGVVASRLSGVHMDVVVGVSNPNREEVRKLCESLPNALYHCQVSNMAELMAKADLAIGGGGSANWERCCLGLPGLIAVLADNQAEPTRALSDYGAIVNLGNADGLSSDSYRAAVDALESDQLVGMGRLGRQLVDGLGCQRVVEAMMASN